MRRSRLEMAKLQVRASLGWTRQPYPTRPAASSGKVVAIEVHHLVPRSYEVLHKRLLRVVTCVGFRDCPELGVRTEDKVDTGAGPLDFARRAIAPLKHVFGCGGRLPLQIGRASCREREKSSL